MDNQDPWWHSFFDDIFASIVLERSNEECAHTIAFLERALNLKKGDLIFDQCCGTGEVSHLFANKGYKTYGVDIIPSYIQRAQKNGHAHSEFSCADAIEYKTPELCDAAINWYTSFGYHKDDLENLKILTRLSESVKPNGLIAIDLANASASYRQGETVRYYKKQTNTGIVQIERRYYFDVQHGMRSSTWKYTLPDGQVVERYGESRLYTASELSVMLNKAGFKVLEFYGDLYFGALALDSVRCICVAQKVA